MICLLVLLRLPQCIQGHLTCLWCMHPLKPLIVLHVCCLLWLAVSLLMHLDVRFNLLLLFCHRCLPTTVCSTSFLILRWVTQLCPLWFMCLQSCYCLIDGINFAVGFCFLWLHSTLFSSFHWKQLSAIRILDAMLFSEHGLHYTFICP